VLVFLSWLDKEIRVDGFFFFFLLLTVIMSKENERNKSLCVLMGLFLRKLVLD
jgi:hypothetical protein